MRTHKKLERVIDGPVLITLAGRSPTQQGVADAVTAGTSRFLSAGSKAAELFEHDQSGLLLMLHRQVMHNRRAADRARWFGGRFYNTCSGENPDYIKLPGSHLRQVLSAAKIETPDFVVAAGQYALRADVAEEALAALHARQSEAQPQT